MKFVIEDYQVHVWQANLKTLSVYPKDIPTALSPEELERANKLRFTRDREHFILRHCQLRLILSKYCDCLPRELMFRYNSYKKPFICVPEFKEIKFNMSYSDDLMLVDLCKQNDIGIDIEKVREMRDLENVAVENFSIKELKYLNGTLDKTNAFFKIWTRKEAFIKAIGKGMYYPLKSFCVDINPSGSYEHLVIFNHPLESKLWRTSELNTSDGYVASMAIKSDRFQISYFQL
jgi:4'-phosphopantetheinyl transferase